MPNAPLRPDAAPQSRRAGQHRATQGGESVGVSKGSINKNRLGYPGYGPMRDIQPPGARPTAGHFFTEGKQWPLGFPKGDQGPVF